jgi:hypothetical protein
LPINKLSETSEANQRGPIPKSAFDTHIDKIKEFLLFRLSVKEIAVYLE